MTRRQSANRRLRSDTAARADQRAATGATKSAGKRPVPLHRKATRRRWHRPAGLVCPRSNKRKVAVAGKATTRLNSAPAPTARLMGKSKSESTGVLSVPAPTPTAEANAADQDGRACAADPASALSGEDEPVTQRHFDGKKDDDRGEDAAAGISRARTGRVPARAWCRRSGRAATPSPAASRSCRRASAPKPAVSRGDEDAGVRRAHGERNGDIVGHADQEEELEQHRHRDDAAANAQQACQQTDQNAGRQQGHPDESSDMPRAIVPRSSILQTRDQSKRPFTVNRGGKCTRRGADYIGTMEVQERHRFDEQ